MANIPEKPPITKGWSFYKNDVEDDFVEDVIIDFYQYNITLFNLSKDTWLNFLFNSFIINSELLYISYIHSIELYFINTIFIAYFHKSSHYNFYIKIIMFKNNLVFRFATKAYDLAVIGGGPGGSL